MSGVAMVDVRSKYYSVLILVALIVALFASGCRRELQAPGLENEILTPILSSKLTINEIVPDSIRSTDEDGFITLTYRNQLYGTGLSSFRELETREFEEVAKLQSLTLSAQSAQRNVTLGQIAQQAGATGQFIISQNGNNTVIPPITGLSYGPLPVDGTEFFETVTLDSGYMDITIFNEFPTGLSNIDFEIRNESDNSLVGSSTFQSVASGGTETQTIDLAGKTIEGALLGNILNFDVDGTSSPVLIDTSDAIVVTVTVRDMKVQSATAIFPAQNIIELGDTSTMQNVDDLRLTRARASSGNIRIRVVSTVEDTMYFNYFVPDGKKDGIPLEINEQVDPAPSGGSIEKIFTYSVADYTFDLTGQPAVDHYNAFYSELTGRIDSTGKVVNLSLEDSILIYVQLTDFVPEYIEGYLGNTQIDVGPESVPIDLFKHFESGTLEFEQVGVSLSVVNGNGVPFNVDIQELSAENTANDQVVDLDISSLPDPVQIQRAPDITSPWIETWELNASSSLNEALNIYPDRLNVALSVTSNPDQDSTDLSQFALDTNDMDAFLDIDIPLSLIAQDLVLSDTIGFDATRIQDVDAITGGTFYLVAENGLPLDAQIEVVFLDGADNVVETISFEGTLEGLTSLEQNVLSWGFGAEAFQNIGSADRAVLRATLNTTSTSTYQRIFSDQVLDATLSARFNYSFEP